MPNAGAVSIAIFSQGISVANPYTFPFAAKNGMQQQYAVPHITVAIIDKKSPSVRLFGQIEKNPPATSPQPSPFRLPVPTKSVTADAVRSISSHPKPFAVGNSCAAAIEVQSLHLAAAIEMSSTSYVSMKEDGPGPNAPARDPFYVVKECVFVLNLPNAFSKKGH